MKSFGEEYSIILWHHHIDYNGHVYWYLIASEFDFSHGLDEQIER